MKRFLKAVVRALLPWRWVKGLNRSLRRLAAAGHRFQHLYEWRLMTRPPEWFDHYTDLYWRWHRSRNPTSWERGIFGLLAIRQGSRVLDLCCGTGFYAYYFYSGRAGAVIAMDYSAAAIAQAKRNFRAPNIEYRQGDIRTGLPEGPFDNVVLNAALEYFTPDEADNLMRNIKARLASGGIVTGNSIVAQRTAAAHLDQKQEFFSREELAAFLSKYFAQVAVLTTRFRDAEMDRTNLYFYASDSAIPLGQDWPDLLIQTRITN